MACSHAHTHTHPHTSHDVQPCPLKGPGAKLKARHKKFEETNRGPPGPAEPRETTRGPPGLSRPLETNRGPPCLATAEGEVVINRYAFMYSSTYIHV